MQYSKIDRGNRSEKNIGWKGEEAKYSTKHFWVLKNKGQAKNYKCEHCGKKAMDWANLDHKYKRKLEDYIPLCRVCHMKYDIKNNNRVGNVAEKAWQSKLCKKNILYIKEKYIKKEFNQTELSKIFSIDQGQISRIINNKAWKKYV